MKSHPSSPSARWVAISLSLICWVTSAQAEPVGISGRRTEVFFPGPELMVKKLQTGKAPLDLRILSVYPHGTAGYRYDLEFIGYEPGKINLADWLAPRTGEGAALPPQEVMIESVLPPGPPGSLEEPPPHPQSWLPSFTVLFGAAAILWLTAGILLWKRKRPDQSTESLMDSEPNAAERLRPLIEQILTGNLDPNGRAELERRLLGFWRERLGLTDLSPRDALERIRHDNEAGQLLRLVEDWLHRPAGSVTDDEIKAALKPYAPA